MKNIIEIEPELEIQARFLNTGLFSHEGVSYTARLTGTQFYILIFPDGKYLWREIYAHGLVAKQVSLSVVFENISDELRKQLIYYLDILPI